MGFKENLKAELLFQGILVKELAEKTGISRRTLDNYLRDKNTSPTAENAVKIAQALGVSAEYLVAGKNVSFVQLPESTDLRSILHEAEALRPEERLLVLDVISALKVRLHAEKICL